MAGISPLPLCRRPLMLDSEYLTVLGLGFVLGLRHALDGDHLVAVSTVLAQRPSWRASGLVGFSWGIGHTLVLLSVGFAVLFFRLPIPEPMAVAAEFGVGVMLVTLGVLLGFRLLRERWHVHGHDHDGTRHVHFHSHAAAPDHGHAHWWHESFRPLCVGMAHGLAGSAALLLVVLASSDSVLQGLGYIAAFGAGSILGMVLVGLALGAPVIWSLSFGRSAFLAIQGLASLGSIVMGLHMMIRIGMGDPPF